MARVVLNLGNDVSTDVIYPGRYMATVLPSETPQFAFADMVEFNKALNDGAIPAGSVIVAGTNFGCGSSREQAASALKGHELIVVARSFARIFLQNAINLGLRLIQAEGIDAREGQEIILEEAVVRDAAGGASWPVRRLPESRQAIIEAGGLIPYTRKRLAQQARPTGIR